MCICWIESAATKSLFSFYLQGQMSRCTDCDSFFIGSDNEFQLARRAKKAGICQGCFRQVGNINMANKEIY